MGGFLKSNVIAFPRSVVGSSSKLNGRDFILETEAMETARTQIQDVLAKLEFLRSLIICDVALGREAISHPARKGG
jgi:hypothetical protein